MDFPKGGSGEIAAALARGVSKHEGCSVTTSSPVEQIVVEEGRAAAVKLKSGKMVRRAEGGGASIFGGFRGGGSNGRCTCLNEGVGDMR